MRLDPKQVLDLADAIHTHFKNEKFELYLYGSRTDDSLKGGDIDLLILTEEKGVKLFEEKELDILVEMKSKSSIGQRRIDLKAATLEDLRTNAFLKVIWPSCIKLT